MQTYADVLGAHDVEIPEHLVAQTEIPLLDGLQRQGDIIIIPARAGADVGTEIPREGIAVVRGENGGNTHLLVSDSGTTWRQTNDSEGFELGTFTVPEGGSAYVIHPEHGAQGFAPGSYRIRRQREQADEIRRVAD